MFLHIDKQRGVVAQAQLAHGADLLCTDGLLAAMKIRGDLAYRQAAGQQADDFQFTG